MSGSYWMEKYWPDFHWHPPYWFGPDFTWPITGPWRVWWQDYPAALAWETTEGWEGTEVWHIPASPDPVDNELLAERKFHLGALMSGETGVFGRRIQSVTTIARAPAPDSGALVKVRWKDITVYSAT